MALQRSITHATPLERSFRFILIFAGDAQAHRQLLRIPRGCESIILLVYRKTSAFRGWCCSIFCLLIVGVVRAVCLLDSSQLRCGKQLLTPDTARRCESIVPLHHAMQRSACSRRAYTLYRAIILFRLSYFNRTIRTTSKEIRLELIKRLFAKYSFIKKPFRVNYKIYLFQK